MRNDAGGFGSPFLDPETDHADEAPRDWSPQLAQLLFESPFVRQGVKGATTKKMRPKDRPLENDFVSDEAFEKMLKTQANDVAALIVEPLVLGAAGMRIYSAATLRSLHALCRSYSVIFIADEVMTGWGRTGTRFACEQAHIEPDIVCLSKGLTNGCLPMAATLATEDIYQAFYSTDRAKTFFHSTSFTGNPLA